MSLREQSMQKTEVTLLVRNSGIGNPRNLRRRSWKKRRRSRGNNVRTIVPKSRLEWLKRETNSVLEPLLPTSAPRAKICPFFVHLTPFKIISHQIYWLLRKKSLINTNVRNVHPLICIYRLLILMLCVRQLMDKIYDVSFRNGNECILGMVRASCEQNALLRESKGAFRLPPSWISMKTDVIFAIHWDVSEGCLSPRASERVWGSPRAPKIECILVTRFTIWGGVNSGSVTKEVMPIAFYCMHYYISSVWSWYSFLLSRPRETKGPVIRKIP